MASSSKNKHHDVNSARTKLDGVLQTLMIKAEESTDSSSDESLDNAKNEFTSKDPSPTKRIYVSRAPRKRRRKEEVSGKDTGNCPVSYVMKLFDRSVDLARFNENTSLYPVCRAWMYNDPNNGSVKTEPDDSEITKHEMTVDDEEDQIKDVFYLPAPLKLPKRESNCFIGSRIPPPLPSTDQPLDINAPLQNQPSTQNLLSTHMTRWKTIRQRWKDAGFSNEARYNESLKIIKKLKIIYE